MFPGLRLRQYPGGPIIATLKEGTPVTVLYGVETLNGLVWIEVQDSEGRMGWIPQIYVLTATPTLTPTFPPTETAIP
jgi:SH3-like domain-containing protein